MKTYLRITINSEGAKPSEIVDKLLGLGFKATKGSHDFVYEWDEAADVKDVIWFGDKIHAVLKGSKVLFSMETI
jgi:hypothetical protein